MAHRVLIVDDEPSIRLTLAEFLRREGFEPPTASDAAQGSALFGEGVEVAVVDINLPGRSGIELLRELRERDPRVPVIVITGEPNVSHQPEIVRAGAYDFLSKPVLKDSITRAVARAAERRRLDEEKRRSTEVTMVRLSTVGKELDVVTFPAGQAAPAAVRTEAAPAAPSRPRPRATRCSSPTSPTGRSTTTPKAWPRRWATSRTTSASRAPCSSPTAACAR